MGTRLDRTHSFKLDNNHEKKDAIKRKDAIAPKKFI
jgi:hypothetical protein